MEKIEFNKFLIWVANYNFITDEEKEKTKRIIKELKEYEIHI